MQAVTAEFSVGKSRSPSVRWLCHTAKSDVIVAGVDVPFAASPHHVTGAILISAEERTSTLHPLELLIAWIVAGVRALWITCHDDTGEYKLRIVVGPIPVAAPLPNVACHIVKPVTVRWKLCDRCDPRIAIFDTIVSMPGVRMPYERLVEVCREESVLSVVDAAHCIGMLSLSDMNLGKLQPDF